MYGVIKAEHNKQVMYRATLSLVDRVYWRVKNTLTPFLGLDGCVSNISYVHYITHWHTHSHMKIFQRQFLSIYLRFYFDTTAWHYPEMLRLMFAQWHVCVSTNVPKTYVVNCSSISYFGWLCCEYCAGAPDCVDSFWLMWRVIESQPITVVYIDEFCHP